MPGHVPRHDRWITTEQDTDSLYSRPSASPREISSRSVNVSITRTAGILSYRTTKIKCYDRLNSPRRAREFTAGKNSRAFVRRFRRVTVRLAEPGPHCRVGPL